MPANPATMVRMTLSVRSWLTKRRRGAPNADRIAISAGALVPAGQKEARHVAARGEQHQHRRRHEQQEAQTDRSHQRSMKIHQRQSFVGVGVGVLLLQTARDDVDLALGLFQGNTRLQPANDVVRVRIPSLVEWILPVDQAPTGRLGAESGNLLA